jgi:NNP family nitrate/nitrite transporter-like MFS transporter
LTPRGFWNSGHRPTLLAAFLYFDVSFMVWVLLGPLGPFLGDALKLSASQKGLLAAVPLLGGSLFRPIAGFLVDRIGGRRAGLLGLALTLAPLALAWRFAAGFPAFLLVGLLLGVAGASFAVALPLAGRWYPPEHQGLALGIAGAGNSGTLFATLLAPRLAQTFGWQNVFGLAMLPVAIVWLVFALLAKDSPRRVAPPAWSDYLRLLREPDAGWFCALYSLTFGGFVGLASFLTVFFHDQYALGKVHAGDLTTVVVFSGSVLRPVGGLLADRIGGFRLLLAVLLGVGFCLAQVAALPPLDHAVALLAVSMGLLGMGNGAVFQLIPQRFPREVSLLTGIVGAAGGVGGFVLPSMLGELKERTGSFGVGLFLFGVIVLGGSALLLRLGARWRASWPPASAGRAGLAPARLRDAA